jgi:hypothetical protein
VKTAGPIICLVIGVALLVLGVLEQKASARLQRDGVEADAIIVDKKETHQRRGKRRTVSLSFRDQEGREHTTSASGVSSSAETWRKPIGDTVRILYLSSDPRTTHVIGRPTVGPLPFVGGFLTLLGIVLAVRSSRGQPRTN